MENGKWKMRKNRKPKLLTYWQVFLRFQEVAKLFSDLLNHAELFQITYKIQPIFGMSRNN